MKLKSKFRGILAGSACLVTFFPAYTSIAEVTFTRLLSGELVEDPGQFFGSSWGDYDGDGYPDLVLTGIDGNRLYHNNGDGTLTRIESSAIAEDMDGWPVWADYDNDGYLDLFVSSFFHGPDRLYRNLGDGSFSRVILDPEENIVNHSACWGDLDNDGFVDLFVANTANQVNYFYRNNGDGSLTGGPAPELGGSAVSHLSQWTDYDMDRDVDLLVAQVDMHFRNDKGVLVRGEGSPYDRGTFEDIDIASADYDNDGDLDLVVVGMLGNRLYTNDGAGNFTEVLDDAIQGAGIHTSSCAAWGDYDNDGKIDLFVGNFYDEADLLFHNEGGGVFSQVTEGPLVNRKGYNWSASWADYDNDGDLDLVTTDGFFEEYPDLPPRPFVLYRNDGGTNNWLEISLKGTVSNASAIGAKVYVTATINGEEVTQLREITGHASDLRAHFGLGDATIVDRIVIEWPSGNEWFLDDVEVNQIRTVEEYTSLSKFVYRDLSPNGLHGCIIDRYIGNDPVVTVPGRIRALPVAVGEDAFENCSHVNCVIFPDNITSIPKNSFTGCNGLERVIIGKDVSSIKVSAFSGCSNLTGIQVSDLNPDYYSLNGVLYQSDEFGDYLLWYPQGRVGAYTIPDGIRGIGRFPYDLSSDRFNGCPMLTSVTIPASVGILGMDDFRNCENLKSVFFNGDVPLVYDPHFGAGGLLTSPILNNVFRDSPNVVIYYRKGTAGWDGVKAINGRPAETWYPSGPYKVVRDDFADTFLGWAGLNEAAQAGEVRWVWSYQLKRWIQVRDVCVEADGGWVYAIDIDTLQLDRVMDNEVETNWTWSRDLQRWIYRSPSVMEHNRGWILICREMAH